MGYTVAVVGATGAVGTRMIQQLEQSTLPIDKVRLLSSSRSAGKVLKYKGQDVTVELTTEDSFEGVDIALFSAGGSVSAKFAPYAVKAGAVVVDNTSYFRQNPDVHLSYLKSMLTPWMLTTVSLLVQTAQLSNDGCFGTCPPKMGLEPYYRLNIPSRIWCRSISY